MLAPVIKLEQLTQKETKRILYVIYSVVIVGIVISVLEPRWSREHVFIDDSPCHPTNPREFLDPWNHKCSACSQLTPDGATEIILFVNLDRLELYFELEVLFSSTGAAEVKTDVPIRTRLLGVNQDLNVDSVILDQSRQQHLVCHEGKLECEGLELLSERDYMYVQHGIYPLYEVHIVGPSSFDLRGLGGLVADLNQTRITYDFNYHSATYRGIQVAARISLVGITLLALYIWLRALRNITPTKEQHWVTIMLVCLVAFIDPFYAPVMLHQVESLWALSLVFAETSKAVLFCMWLCTLHGMSGRPREWQSFYLPKVAIASVYLFGSILSLASSSFTSNEGAADTGLVLQTVALVLFAYFLHRYITSAKNRLYQLPYVTTRYRQLAFRFFVVVTSLVFVYLLIQNFVESALRKRSEGAYWDSFGQVVVVSVYLLLTVYVYLPVNAVSQQLKDAIERMRGESARGIQPDVYRRSLAVLPDKGRYQLLQDSESGGGGGHGDPRPSSVAHGGGGGFGVLDSLLGSATDDMIEDEQQDITVDDTEPAFDQDEDLPYASPFETADRQHVKDMFALDQITDASVSRAPAFSLQTALWLVYFANQAYRDFDSAKPGGVDILKEFGFSLRNQFEDVETDTHGFIATKENLVVISFRGTASKQNALTDLKFKRIKTSSLIEPFAFFDDIRIHEGFVTAYSAVQRTVTQAMTEIIGDGSHPLTVYCTGHSLGGALAMLCAFSLANAFQSLPIRMYNFGSPRVGNHKFASVYNELVPGSYRVVFDRDMVTSVPKFCCLYKHAGNEILVDKRGNYIINPLFIEKYLRASKTRIKDHSLVSYRSGLRSAVALTAAISHTYDGHAPDHARQPSIDVEHVLAHVGNGQVKFHVGEESFSMRHDPFDEKIPE